MIELKNVTKTISKKEILSNINQQFDEGKLVVLRKNHLV